MFLSPLHTPQLAEKGRTCPWVNWDSCVQVQVAKLSLITVLQNGIVQRPCLKFLSRLEC